MLRIVLAGSVFPRVEVFGHSEAVLYGAPIQQTLTLPLTRTLLVTIGLSQSQLARALLRGLLPATSL